MEGVSAETLKKAMIQLTYADWQQSMDPAQDEMFQALIVLIEQGAVSAYYDDDQGCVLYSANI